MREIKIDICKNAVLTIRVTDEMDRDIKECEEASKQVGGRGKDCNTCRWNNVEIDGTCLCEWPIVCEKLMGG